MSETCRNCEHFQKFYLLRGDGLCRRMPPQLECNGSGFPTTYKDDTCGEFKFSEYMDCPICLGDGYMYKTKTVTRETWFGFGKGRDVQVREIVDICKECGTNETAGIVKRNDIKEGKK